jgi:nucleoside-diphosphate-sugar epimerase
MLASYEKTGAVCYIGEGLNCYTTVHVDDLADLYLAAAERGAAGALYHAASGEVPNRAIAELLAKRLGCETRSVTMDEAMEIWDKFAVLIVLAASSRSRSPRSREELGWVPTRTDIIGEFLTGELVVGRNAPGVSNSR